MSMSVAEHRRCRGTAKGTITRVSSRIKTLKSVELSKLDLRALQKQLESLEQADESFQNHHEAIQDQEDDLDQDQHELELNEQQNIVCILREAIRDLQDRHAATQVLRELDDALESLELCSKDGYETHMDLQLEEVQKLAQEFRKARAKGTANECPDLRHARDDRMIRISNLQKAREKAKPVVTTGGAAVPTTVQVNTPNLKLDLPTFDGDVLKWRDFWSLFSSVLEKETTLNDKERCCHLIKAMTSPEAKTQAETAVAYTSTYEEAVARMKERYEQNRVVYSHHLGDVLQTDLIKEDKRDMQRLLDRLEKNIRGMKASQGYTIEQLLAAHSERLMAPGLLKQWRKSSAKHLNPPPIEDLLKFLKEQIKATPDIPLPKKEKDMSAKTKTTPLNPKKTILHTQPAGDKCAVCSGSHMLYLCSQFKEKSPQQRKDLVKASHLCFNCLSPRHKSADCPSRHRCKECSGHHHSLIHIPKVATPDGEVSNDGTILTTSNKRRPAYVLPRTAIVCTQVGSLQQKARAQLDSGASISLITARLATTLKAPRVPDSSLRIAGVGGVLHSPYSVELTLIGTEGETLPVQAQVVDSIPRTSSPEDVQGLKKLPFLRGLHLADPNYTPDSRIDILLDMGLSNVCLREGVLHSTPPGLKAENTIFGWSVGGTASQGVKGGGTPTSTCLKASPAEDDTDHLLQRFWELEKIPSGDTVFAPEEELAVHHFQDTFSRDEDGRYRVSLPRRTPTPELGRSRDMALKRYLSNERNLKKQGSWEQFHEAVADYGQREHAEPVPAKDLGKLPANSYYMPMHGVVKASSTTTKLRAVCDASAKTSTGVSLNDTLLPGPSLYPLLTTVINRFRLTSIGMSADISKMFREVGLQEEDMDFHRFLLRDDKGEIKDWRMTRLTFGVTTSPFLATQVLRQLAEDYRQEFPLAAKIIESSFYVDDVLTGADNIQQAKQIREELNGILQKGCMILRKWRSSSPQLLETIPEDLREMSDLRITTAPGDCPKALGLHWSTSSDSLHVATPDIDMERAASKRYVASTVAKIFDVLGWFSPATLPAKILLQETWTLKLGWDESLPKALQTRWQAWAKELPAITAHPVPRHLGAKDKKVATRQLLGFSDASTLAYGGVIYLRTLYTDATVSVDLIASKARVAPLKELTVPRLELCGALLLSQLLHSVAGDLGIPKEDLFAWSDSSAVLGWMHKAATRLPVFVAHRISKINSLIDPSQWSYVESSVNPADLLSRGLPPKELLSAQLWWKGPPWLTKEPALWPKHPNINFTRELPELKPTVLSIRPAPEEFGCWCSNFTRLMRVTAWIFRFYYRVRKKSKTPTPPHLTLQELRSAKTTLLKHSQRTSYSVECQLLEEKKELPISHPLSALSPYLDEAGLLRVGGRLQKASLSAASTHPLILDVKSHITQILVRHTHQVLLHAGPSTVMSTLAETYHIPRLKRLLRKISRACTVCQKAYSRTAKQLMGELPAARTRPARPFSIVGMDFAGPLLTKRGSPRKPTLIKTYVCVFICFVSRAVHFELVADLSTGAFLAAMNRFTARRGVPSEIFSDNGTNFVGAQAELQRIKDLLRSQDTQEAVIYWASQKDIQWHFSPAKAPHFGGLWEAAVKSMKLILKKTIGDKALAPDELLTVVTEAEAIVNSRPLAPMDSPADDGISPLTPGHFLVGGPLAALPTQPDTVSKISTLKRWNLVQRLNSDLWKRWRVEYLLLLQRKAKWKRAGQPLQLGDIVLVKDDPTFRGSWPMGRITQLYPGTDGHTRVVDVLLKGKTYRRPIHKLVPMLRDEGESSSLRGEDVQAA